MVERIEHISDPKTWFTSDLHFGHTDIIQYTNRPYESTAQMNADLIQRWNSVVHAEDEVFVLGDMCMGRLDDTLPLVSHLNGIKNLIPGNHDRMYDATGEKYSEWVIRYMDAGFKSVFPPGALVMQLHGITVLLSHFPYERDERHGDRHADSCPVDTGLPLLHGHLHGQYRKRGRQVDVGVDTWGGYPVCSTDAVAMFTVHEGDAEPLPWTAVDRLMRECED